LQASRAGFKTSGAHVTSWYSVNRGTPFLWKTL